MCWESNVWHFGALNVLGDFSSCHKLLELPMFLKKVCKKDYHHQNWEIKHQQSENLEPVNYHSCSEGAAITILHHSQLEAPKFPDMSC